MSEISKKDKISFCTGKNGHIAVAILKDVCTQFNMLVDSDSEYKTLKNVLVFESEQQLIARFAEHIEKVKQGKLHEEETQ